MQRLKTRPQFQAAMAGGTVSRTAHFALHRLMLESTSTAPAATQTVQSHLLPSQIKDQKTLFAVEAVWLGAMVPKRWARRAVTRNAIKRQIYAVGAGFETCLPQAAHVVRLRCAFDRTQFLSAASEHLRKAVRAELLELFEHAIRRDQAATPSKAVP